VFLTLSSIVAEGLSSFQCNGLRYTVGVYGAELFTAITPLLFLFWRVCHVQLLAASPPFPCLPRWHQRSVSNSYRRGRREYSLDFLCATFRRMRAGVRKCNSLKSLLNVGADFQAWCRESQCY
jgi:hypothetical protein